MALICYKDIKLRGASLLVVERANDILHEYAEQGFDLTLRQLYYQFVSRGLIANNIREYKKLGSIVNDARLAGLIDWDHIVDRTRNVRSTPHWRKPSEIIAACAEQFRIDKWKAQQHRIEVWIEKDALIGVIEGVCRDLDVPYFSCRGYVSQSEIHEAAKDRLIPYQEVGQDTTIIHLGDHDPSGIDMSRDIQDRLKMFGAWTEVVRIALNRDQVDQYNPPPNPAKLTDSRAEQYVREHGDESWELDALEPSVIGALIRKHALERRDEKLWRKSVEDEAVMRQMLRLASDGWDGSVVPMLSKLLVTEKKVPTKPKRKKP